MRLVFMQAEYLRRCLDSEQDARQLFASWNLHDIDRGQSNLARLAHFDPIDRDPERAVVCEARIAAGHEQGS